MRKPIQRVLAVLLAILMITGTMSVAFAASVGQVKKLSLATRTSTQIKIKWKAVSKADGYLVESYDSDEEEWNIEDYTSATYFVDKALSAGTKYIYRVKAYVKEDGERVFGKASEKLSVLTDPERVTKVTAAETTPTSVKLQWAEAAGATSYIVYQAKTEDGKYKQLAETKKTAYTVKFEAAPGPVFFKVKAIAKSGSLQRAAEASPVADVNLTPAAVAEVTVSDSSAASVTLKWAKCKGATGYLVMQRDVSTGEEYTQIAKTTKTSYQVNFPCAPGTVYFKVQSFSKLNGVTTKAKLSPAIKQVLKPEDVTTLFAMNEASSSVTLSWNAADGASGYEVYKRDESTYTPELLTTVTDTTYTVHGLSNDTACVFFVRAIADYKGNVQHSAMSPACEAKTGFGNIQNFHPTMDDNGKAILSWSEVKGADGYIVEKSETGKDDGGWKQIADTKSTVIDVSALEPGGKMDQGQKYFYRVCAYTTENGQKITTPYSEVVNLHGQSEVPKLLRVQTSSKSSVLVEWEAVEGADGYSVQWKDINDTEWINYEYLISSKEFRTYINENGVKAVYYRIGQKEKGINENHNMQIRVRSYVVNGTSNNYSEFSNVLNHKYEYVSETPAWETAYTPALQQYGFVGYLYDPVEGVFCTADDPWQRNFGFNPVYDNVSQFVMIQYDTARIEFTCHDGEQWMIQPWKGQYGMVLFGGEVGIYKKYTERDVEHYDCAHDEDLMMMEMRVKKYNANSKKDDSDEVQWPTEIHRPLASYWWITGFKFGFIRMVNPLDAQKFRNYPDLRIDFSIRLFDFEMRNEFVKAVNEMNLKEETMANGKPRLKLLPYEANDLTLNVIFQ